jgi:creatinine amidohydrolase
VKDQTWPELAECAARSVLVVPLGATEQHGPHLPYTVDTEVATRLAEELAGSRADMVPAPALPYGSSGEHAAFPGTLSIGAAATEAVLTELGRSADGFAGLLFVCAHGGNAEPLRAAVARLRYEGRDARAWCPPGSPTDSHAGRTETSVMLALRPATVRLAALARGAVSPLPELMPALADGGVAAVSPSGVLGDPSGATAEEGVRILAEWADSLRAYAAECWPAAGDTVTG